MIYYILTFLFFQMYAAISGYKDGILYSRQGSDALPWDEHILYTWERIAVGGIFTSAFLSGPYLYFLNPNPFFVLVPIILMCFAALATFSFWHNGFYNISRQKIDMPSASFWSNSQRWGVKFHFSVGSRSGMAIIGYVAFTLISYALLH